MLRDNGNTPTIAKSRGEMTSKAQSHVALPNYAGSVINYCATTNPKGPPFKNFVIRTNLY